MGTPLANRRRVDLPPLFADEAFRIAFPITNDVGESLAFTGQTVELLLKKSATSVSILSSDTASVTVSLDGLTLYVSKPATWTTDTLTVGMWKYSLYVGTNPNREVWAFGSFNVVARGDG